MVDKNSNYNIPQHSWIVNAGTYKVRLRLSKFGGVAYADTSFNDSNLSWSWNADNFRQQLYALNGMMFAYSDRHHYFSEQHGMDGRAPADKWNVPGVLLSATVALAGGFSNWWGAKKHASNTAVKVASTSGTYDIYHSIGHTNYQVSLTPHSNRTFCVGVKDIDKVRVYFYTNAATPVLSDTAFDVQITGNNY